METFKLWFGNEQKDVVTKRPTMALLAELRALRTKHKEAFKYDSVIAEVVGNNDAEALKQDKQLVSKLMAMQSDAERNNAYDAYLLDFAKAITSDKDLSEEDAKAIKTKAFWEDQDVLSLQVFVDSFRNRIRA